jgi:hypothetical protein
MNSCGRQIFCCCCCCCCCSLSLSLLIFDLFHKLGLWSSLVRRSPLSGWREKATLIYTFFLRTHLSDFNGMSFESEQRRTVKKPRQTGLRIEFTSGILHFSHSRILFIFFCLNIMNTKSVFKQNKKRDKEKNY